MPVFVRQCAISTDSVRTRSRTNYLASFRAEAIAAIATYRAADPGGSEYTLIVLRRIGEARLREAAREAGRSLDTAKKDVGIWVALCLVDEFSDAQVETLRAPHAETGRLRAATRTVPIAFGDLAWVGRYTPHRVTLGLGPVSQSSWRRQVVQAARRRPHEYGVYAVWKALLLSQVPDPCPPAQALPWLRGLAAQASWAEKAPAREAVQAKVKALERYAGPDAAATAADHWNDDLEQTQREHGVGRFVGFHLGFNVFDSSPRAAASLLGALVRMASPNTTAAEAVRLAHALTAQPGVPFEAVARFSECLHLARPDVFPFVNEQQSDIVAHLAGFTHADHFDAVADAHDIAGRDLYLQALPWLQSIKRALDLPDYNALDDVLLAFGGLFDEYGSKVYWDEVARFSKEVVVPPKLVSEHQVEGP